MQFTVGSITSAALLTLTLVSSAAAIPVEIEARGGTASQSCTAKQYVDLEGFCQNGQARYTVAIAVTYAEGRGCDRVKQELQHATARNGKDAGNTTDRFIRDNLDDYTCNADDAGNTVLAFDLCLGYGAKANAALTRMYPMVNGFNCPDY